MAYLPTDAEYPIMNLSPDPVITPEEDEIADEDLAKEEVENTGMETGQTFKEDQEQDLDDLIHSKPGSDPNRIPPPEEL